MLQLEDFMPMSPLEGPPLPRFLQIYWPWYEAPPEAPPTGVPWGFSNVQCSLGDEFPGDWWQVNFEATIKNEGDSPATKTVTLYERSFVPVIGGGFWTAWSATQTFPLTLAPGESYQWSTSLSTLYAGGEFYVAAYLKDSDGYESAICQAPSS